MTPLGIVGASARAAAGSAVRAGFAPWAVDLFADRDLRRIADVVRCPMADYPAALPRLMDSFPPGPVLYTGGLENHPDVVRDLAARRELWGNPPEVLHHVRDPFRLHSILTSAGFDTPRVLPFDAPLPLDSLWLRKPFRSAAGHGIRLAAQGDTPRPQTYLQEFLGGPPMSALFATSEAHALLLGVTEQLIETPWLHAGPFRYAGNVGGITVARDLTATLSRLGRILTAETGLRGLWGIDFILRDGAAVVLEVNPRYTAGVELLERATAFDAIPFHAACFRSPDEFARVTVTRPMAMLFGKAIYFAPRAITFPPSGPWDAEFSRPFDPWRVPDFADIPDAATAVEAGQPVLTFFTTGDTPAAVRTALQSRAAELDTLFAEHAP